MTSEWHVKAWLGAILAVAIWILHLGATSFVARWAVRTSEPEASAALWATGLLTLLAAALEAALLWSLLRRRAAYARASPGALRAGSALAVLGLAAILWQGVPLLVEG